jgi:hypothetical protein
VRVQLNDGSERVFDHVLLGTGYRVDIERYPFLSPQVLKRIERVDGFPVLDEGFETSLPGMHFVGAPAARSFGPLMRFVAGTEFTAPALAHRILHPKERHRKGRHSNASWSARYKEQYADALLSHRGSKSAQEPGTAQG